MGKVWVALSRYLEVLYIGYVNQSPVANRLSYTEWLGWVTQASGPVMVFKGGGTLILPPAMAERLSGVKAASITIGFKV